MQTKKPDFRLEYADLSMVLREIIERLCRDDWERRSSDRGEFVYYTVGFTAHQVDVQHLADFTSTYPIPTHGTPLTCWFTKAQVAGVQSDHGSTSRKRARDMGVTDQKIDAFVAGRLEELNDLDLANRPDLLGVLADCLEGEVLTQGKRPADDISSRERTLISRDRAKSYLREVGKKFGALLKRIDRLDALEFVDSQLEEASRCYLYGFRRGAVVLAAAAVETHLKRVTGKDWFEKYRELIETAVWSGDLDKGRSEAAGQLFELRRRVVHHAYNPDPEEALSAIDWARGVIGSLQA